MASAIEIEVAGERLMARGDRTLYWPERRILFVADLHLGKGATFRAAGIPVPAGSSEATLEALSRSLIDTQASELVVLGDLWHAKSGRTEIHERLLADWQAQHPRVAVRLIVGNHDVSAGVNGVASETFGPFAARHHPVASEDGYVLCGHLHPSYELKGRGERLRVPCFWFGRRIGVLPAFGELTGTAEIQPEPGDRVLVVGGGQVASVPIGDRPAVFRR